MPNQLKNNELLTDDRYREILWEEAKGCAAFASGKARQIMEGENAEPLPRGNQRWELSWSVQGDIFRIRHPESGKEWYFREAVGHIHTTGTNDITHRMNWWGQAELRNNILYVYRPEGMKIPKIPRGQYLPKAQYRICANVNTDYWRIRDEGQQKLLHVDTIVGSLHLNYLDKGSHIFHVDDMVLAFDRDGRLVAHLIDNDLDWQWMSMEEQEEYNGNAPEPRVSAVSLRPPL